MASTLNIACLASGGGTTVAAVLGAIASGELPHIRCGLVIASRAEAGVIQKALAAGMLAKHVAVIPRREFADADMFGDAIIDACRARYVDVIMQLGFIPRMPGNVIDTYRRSIANQHGGGLDPDRVVIKQPRPDFGGRGMMGKATHAAMFYYGHAWMQRTGETTWHAEVTTHHVENGIDTGDLIARRLVPLYRHDTIDSFVERILPAEHRLQIEVLKHLGMRGRLPSFKRAEPLVPHEMLPCLARAREKATREFPKG